MNNNHNLLSLAIASALLLSFSACGKDTPKQPEQNDVTHNENATGHTYYDVEPADMNIRYKGAEIFDLELLAACTGGKADCRGTEENIGIVNFGKGGIKELIQYLEGISVIPQTELASDETPEKEFFCEFYSEDGAIFRMAVTVTDTCSYISADENILSGEKFDHPSVKFTIPADAKASFDEVFTRMFAIK